MPMTRVLKVASALVLLGATASGVSLLAQKETPAPAAGPRPEKDIKAAARSDDRPVYAVKPGKLGITVVERGIVEAARTESVFCRVEGSRIILSILPEGTQVKKGQLVCELDASTLRNQLAQLLIAGNETEETTKLRTRIENCKLYAPMDGSVVHANDPSRFGALTRPQIEEGATVRERQLIFRLIDLGGPMQVNTKVHESVIDRIRPGLPARTRLDSFPGKILTGTVRDVAPLPHANRFFSSDIKVYTTHVTIDEGLPGLRPGMSAQVEILVSELDDVLSVPVRAVLHGKGKDYVAVKRPDGHFDWREVTLGGHNEDFVEVKRGIQSGELVILDPLALMSAKEKREMLGAPAKPATKR
jgi:multidrug efflux pump subunit AcrA (membrane-fusion protein)